MMYGEEVMYVQFNQDFSSLGIGTSHGWVSQERLLSFSVIS